MREKSERAQREEKILQFWKEHKIFEKTLEKKSPKGDFVFYEGPPTANGRPAIHHLEARAFKDAIPRYKTMRGFRVPRKAGWDTHGLPVELEVEKTLGLQSKKEIEKYGIAKFNKACRASVQKYIGDWAKFTDRIGYWVNLDDAYFTYNNSYIESVWSILAHVEERKLLYKDYKVLPWCPRCGTALSSHELAQGYQEVKDISLYVKFKVVGQENTYLVAWTTTPWTLPGNVALAVDKDIEYVKYKWAGEFYIVAKKLAHKWPGLDPEEFLGKDLVGLEYEPLYGFSPSNENSHKVYAADFVTAEDGTGIVHTAVMYGQDDFVLGTKVGLPKHHLVDETGYFKPETGFIAGKSVVEESTAIEILKDLQNRNLLLDKESYTHSYPFCWRCKTRLIYYARDSWYIRMSELRDNLVEENKKINWEPEHIREGRFGEWLREVKDWAISRERYWGTPLPIWQNVDGSQRIVVGSLETLKKYTKTSGNKYFVMRHGEAESNAKNVLDLVGDPDNHLTDKGKKEAEKINGTKFDLIFSSPFLRARETAEIIAKDFIQDERLRETGPNEDGTQIQHRVGEFMFEIESKYKNKNILIISHGEPIARLEKVASGNQLKFVAEDMPRTGEVRKLDFAPLPHNEDFELDLHKPYIDEIMLVKDGEEYRRVKEVLDVWFDSGAMPFAQDPQNILYPADFISEAIDQTRGWFYTLHAIGVLMERGLAYKNVVCLGHLLDKDGKKMSKSVGNVVDPWEMMDKYGIDALRLWMYAVNQPGESKNFDERTVEEQRKMLNTLDNVYSFYELYRDRSLESRGKPVSDNILDHWVVERLTYLIEENTGYLDDYKLLEPVRNIRDFIDDLSTWYLRRSRERIKSGDVKAKQTLYFVLKQLSMLLAPFAPFTAEDLYQKLRREKDPLSIHLEKWPEGGRRLYHVILMGYTGKKLLRNMSETRTIVSLALEARSKANIKVRQPLRKLEARINGLNTGYIELIKDEINVKEVIHKDIGGVELDTNLTSELLEEGKVRDAIRAIQDLRKEKGLKPNDKMKFTPPMGEEEFFKKHMTEIERATNIELEY
ncbi:MAG: class I tRNA ligase family protein [bacterium]|nr:class I tRNA ligase family protein [bacterium]